MRANAPLYSLNAGEVSKIALARVDVAKLRMAAQCQVNWLPYVMGPMMLRPGLFYVGEVLGDAPARLIRFVFSKLDTALIELTANQMRVWIDETLLSRAAVGTSIGDPWFQNTGAWKTTNTTSGAVASVGSGLCTLACPPVGGLAQVQQAVPIAAADLGKRHAARITVTQGPVVLRAGSAAGAEDVIAQTTLDTGTHSLAFTPASASITFQIESTDPWAKTLTGCVIESAGAVVLPTPWGAEDLPDIRYDQSGDIIFIACYGQQQYKIERRAADSWSTVRFYANDGPFQALPGISANFTPGAYFGNTTLTSDRPWFQPGHVGCLFRLFSPGQVFQTMLGGNNAYTPAMRVSGIGADRKFAWSTSGTWAGTLTLQRSMISATDGFCDVATATANGNNNEDDTTNFNNVICWYRVGFKANDYTSGAVTVLFAVYNSAIDPSHSLVGSPGGGTATAGSAALAAGGYGVCRVTGYVSPTLVNIQVLSAFSSLGGTTDWVEGAWSGIQGWPTSVCFHEGRLGWFGGDEIWLSASDDFTSYADINPDGTSTGDGGAIDVTLGSGPVDTISWGLSLTRLLIGREQSIGSARSSNFDQPLTPTQIVIRDCSDQGAERLPAIKAGKRGIFVQQSGRRVFELAFNGQEMDYDERDLTRLNIDIGLPGFVDIDKATQPDKMIFLPRSDGQCAALLYDVKDEVEAWWRIQTLGVIENVAVLPQDAPEDLVYFVVNRTVNGVTRRFIERLAPRADCVGGAINQQLDCHVVYQGSPVTSVALPQLPNTLCSVWADGAAIGSGITDSSGNLAMPDGQSHANVVAGLAGAVINATQTARTGALSVGTQYNGCPAELFADIGGTGEPVHIGCVTVQNGAVTLPNGQQAFTCIALLGYVAPFMSAKLAYGAQLGSALTQRKRIDHVGLVLYDTAAQGLQFGQRFDVLDGMPLYEAGQATPAATTWSEYDEPMIEVPGSWNTDARLCLLAQAPNPCTVGAVVVGMETKEKG